MQVDREGRARDPEKTKGDIASISERLTRLERRVQDLSEAISRLDRAAPEGESQLQTDASAEDLLSIPRPAGSTLATLFFQTGRSLLVIGGAFLVRAFTEAGLWAKAVGVAIGIAYAVSTVLLAGRAAKKTSSTTAAFLGVTAALIAYPLVWEATTKFGVFSSWSASVALAVLTALALAAAVAFDLPALCWSSVAGFLATDVALLFTGRDPLPLLGALVFVGGSTLWCGDERLRWRLPSWPAAIAADVAVAFLSFTVSAPASRAVFLLALALVAVYIGSFAVATIALRRAVTLFAWVQTGAVLLCGLGSAAHIATQIGWSTVALGAGCLAAGLCAYTAAFASVAREDRARLCAYAATFALVLTIWGGALALGEFARGWLWCVLALSSLWLDERFGPVHLRGHAAVYALAAAWDTGFFALLVTAWSSQVERPWRGIESFALLAMILAAACWTVLLKKGSVGSRWRSVPGFLFGFLSVAGAGALLVLVLERLWEGHSGLPDAPARAAIRTGALAAAALVLSVAWRRLRVRELAGLAIFALAAGALKLLVDDFPQGRPASLFVAFALYGTALILVPRTLRRGVLAAR
jgi:hypothetical protein